MRPLWKIPRIIPRADETMSTARPTSPFSSCVPACAGPVTVAKDDSEDAALALDSELPPLFGIPRCYDRKTHMKLTFAMMHCDD